MTCERNQGINNHKYHRNRPFVLLQRMNIFVSFEVLNTSIPSGSNPSHQLFQLSRAPSAFMSSRKAIYESSMLCGFCADVELGASVFAMGAGGFGAARVVETDGLGFDFGAVISLLTRTDAGI